MTVLALAVFVDRAATMARTSYAQAMRRGTVRRALHRFSRDHSLDRARSKAHAAESPAMTFVRQLVRLWKAGATPAELLQLADFPRRALALLLLEGRPLHQIDSEETRLDGQEDELQMRRILHAQRTGSATPALLREEADVCAVGAAIYAERELALRAEADRLERCGEMVA